MILIHRNVEHAGVKTRFVMVDELPLPRVPSTCGSIDPFG